MNGFWAVFKRELKGYFSTPVAYVFLVIFLFFAGYLPFKEGFFELRQADLSLFFKALPLLFIFMVPSVAMRLWAEERKTGSVELLLTLPITVPQAVLGKFFAAWAFSAIALLLTFPLWITVNYLGNPDNGVILASYLGSLLMAGAFLAIGACVSSLTRNQVIAFVVSAVVCLGFVLSGFPLVLDFFSTWAPGFLVQAVSSFSFLSHFNAISEGVIEFQDIVFFVSLIVFWLFANAVVVDIKKAD